MFRTANWRSHFFTALCALIPALLWPQQFSKLDRELTKEMLRDAAADVKKYYYDAKFHGLDWDAEVGKASERVDKADSMDAAVSEIAALLDKLNDSHTSFSLPPRDYVHDYGFTMRMVGEHCYVTHVRPGSDAEKKGLKPGDEILSVNEHPVSRKTFWRIEYIYWELRPQAALHLTLRAADGNPSPMDVVARVEPSTVLRYYMQQGINQRIRDRDAAYSFLEPRYFDKGEALLVVKIPELTMSPLDVDNIIGKMRKHRGVVIDLRGNPGGFVETLERFLGGMFEKDLKIFDRVARNSTKPVLVSGRGHYAFTGRLTVLVDSESASASELFARVLQLEKRAFVLGDRTSGFVMEAIHYPHKTSYHYGISVTEADLIMNDGKSLEHVGVEPDFVILPTATDLANGTDPAMSKAAGLVGAQLTPEEAGAAFPYRDFKPR